MPYRTYYGGLNRLLDLSLPLTASDSAAASDSGVATVNRNYQEGATDSAGASDSGIAEVIGVRIPAAMTHFWPMIFYVAGMTRPLLRVRRSSDNTEQDFSWGSNGLLDTAAILAFCGGGSGFVSKAYHVSNATYDLVQATTSLQPRIVNAGVLEQDIYGLPFLRSMTTGANVERLAVTNLFAATQDYTMFAVACPLTNMTLNNANNECSGIMALGTVNSSRLNLSFGATDSFSAGINAYYVSTGLKTGAGQERAIFSEQPVIARVPKLISATVKATSHKLRVNMIQTPDATEVATEDPNSISATTTLQTHNVISSTLGTYPQKTTALYCAGISASLSESDRATLENNVFSFLKNITGAEF